MEFLEMKGLSAALEFSKLRECWQMKRDKSLQENQCCFQALEVLIHLKSNNNF